MIIEKVGERLSWISVLIAQHDDDDDGTLTGNTIPGKSGIGSNSN